MPANGLPNITVTTNNNAAVSPGFIVTGQYVNSGPANAFILDADGAYVWWYNDGSDVGGAHMSYDGKYMWIASVNKLVVPVGTPIRFELTSSSVMNSFFVPQLGSQIYTMSGMATRLHLQADHLGTYPGISAMFSGDGFPDMHFTVDAVTDDRFAQWVRQTHEIGSALDKQAYADLVKPSKAVAPFTYRAVASDLFGSIVSADMGRQDSICSTSQRAER